MSEVAQPSPTTITIIANGKPRAVQVGSTVADLLEELTIAPARVVVQLDGIIVERSGLDNAVLQEGSKLEIVTLVGGGQEDYCKKRGTENFRSVCLTSCYVL